MENNGAQMKKFIEIYARNQETLDFYKLSSEFKKHLLKYALEESCGNITKCAEYLRIQRTTCNNLLKVYGLATGKMGQTKIRKCKKCGRRVVMKIDEIEIPWHKCLAKPQL